IGIRGDFLAVNPHEGPFDALRRVIADSAHADRVVAQISYPDRPEGPGTASFIRLTEYVQLDHEAGSAVLVTRREPASDLLAAVTSADAEPAADTGAIDADFDWRPAITEEEFAGAVQRFRSTVTGDDIGGVVLSVPMESTRRADAVASYRVLRAINPS